MTGQKVDYLDSLILFVISLDPKINPFRNQLDLWRSPALALGFTLSLLADITFAVRTDQAIAKER